MRIAYRPPFDWTALVSFLSKRTAAPVELFEDGETARDLPLERGRSLEESIRRLTSIKGIGPWTANYIAMRALREPDAFPAGDLGLQKAVDIKSEKRLLRIAEAWRPWRAYAAMLLWTPRHSERSEESRRRDPSLRSG